MLHCHQKLRYTNFPGLLLFTNDIYNFSQSKTQAYPLCYECFKMVSVRQNDIHLNSLEIQLQLCQWYMKCQLIDGNPKHLWVCKCFFHFESLETAEVYACFSNLHLQSCWTVAKLIYSYSLYIQNKVSVKGWIGVWKCNHCTSRNICILLT